MQMRGPIFPISVLLDPYSASVVLYSAWARKIAFIASLTLRKSVSISFSVVGDMYCKSKKSMSKKTLF